MDFSIMHYYSTQASRCGYCKGKDTSVAHGMHAYNIMPQDYQDLIDRGWRRSGHYMYKPEMHTTCCPSYTIKCDALDFKMSKSHKKIIKRMNRFLREGPKTEADDSDAEERKEKEGEAQQSAGEGDGGGGGCGMRDEPQEPDVEIPEVNLQEVADSNPIRHAAAVENSKHFDQPKPSVADGTSSNGRGETATPQQGGGPPCKKAKQIRLERKKQKLAAKGLSLEDITKAKAPQTKEKSLRELLNEHSPKDVHKLKFAWVHVKSEEFKRSLATSYALYEKYQIFIHNDPPESVDDYLAFLVKSPLQRVYTQDGPEMGYGSFHQQYWLDDKLIAVAVIDILPYCLSSVYFFYDPDYSQLSLGTYASLREIAFVQELAEKYPALKHYYMGYYIHSCPKMRYKGKLSPSYLLCPETYTWSLLTQDILDKLDQHKYQRLNPDKEAKDHDEFQERNLNNVLLLIKQGTQRVIAKYSQYIMTSRFPTLDNMLDIVRSRIYKEITGDADERESIIEYGRLVGKTCSQRMLYLV